MYALFQFSWVMGSETVGESYLHRIMCSSIEIPEQLKHWIQWSYKCDIIRSWCMNSTVTDKSTISVCIVATVNFVHSRLFKIQIIGDIEISIEWTSVIIIGNYVIAL